MRYYTRKALLISVVIFIAAVSIGVVTFQITSRSRYRVVGKTDSKSGYRIEYSISSQYYKTKLENRVGQPVVMMSYVHGSGPPPPLVQWVNQHILNRPRITPPNYNGNGSSLHQLTYTAQTGFYLINADGYAEVGGKAPYRTVYEHTIVSGFPATHCLYDVPPAGKRTSRLRVESLIIHPKDSSIIYVFYGNSSGDQENEDMRREMAAVRDSILIVKDR